MTPPDPTPPPAADPADEHFEHARTCFLEGAAAFEDSRYDAAARLFEMSLRLLPDRPSTLVNLAAARLKLGESEAALAAADAALATTPDDLEACFHRGAALTQLGRHDQALIAFGRVLAIDPRHAVAWSRRALALHKLGRLEHAVAAYDKAVEFDPGLALAWSHRGGLLREMGRLDDAAASFEQAIVQGGDSRLNAYYLASVRAGDTPDAAPRHYVRSLFDDYAGDYDRHLVEELRYRAHTALIEPLTKLTPPFGATLDLGCGTGLCGPLLAPIARPLTGVDLSAEMLRRAKSLGVYETLVQADLVDFLRETDARFDLLVAADVFIYVGDLAPVFAGAHRVLRSGGVFAFTAEAAADPVTFTLLPSLRYAHGEAHLRELAERHDFKVGRIVRQTIREDQGRAVEALLVYLQRH